MTQAGIFVEIKYVALLVEKVLAVCVLKSLPDA